MLSKKILKTPYTKVKVKDLELPIGIPEIVEYIMAYPFLVDTYYSTDEVRSNLLKEMKKQEIELGVTVYDKYDTLNYPYTIQLFKNGAFSFSCINALQILKKTPIGTTLDFKLSTSSSDEGFRIKILYEDDTFITTSNWYSSTPLLKSLTITKPIKDLKIEKTYTGYSNTIIRLQTDNNNVTLVNHSYIKFNTPINFGETTDTSKIIDDKTSFIPITLRDATLGTLKDYFTNEELVTLFNYFVDYNYNLSTSYLTSEGIDDFYKRFRILNTKALFRLATRINKIVELLNTDKMQDRKDIISRIKIDMLDKEDVISNTSNIKQADNPSSITGELVDTFTTSQQKTTNSGTNVINEERNVTDNESLSSEGATINKINDYYNSINFDIIDEYVNSFNSLIIYDDEEDLQFESF